MIELIERIGNLIYILAELMRSDLFAGGCDHIIRSGQLQLKILLTVADSSSMCRRNYCRTGCLTIFRQDRLDTNDRVQDIWAGVAFEGNKTIHIEYIVLGRLVGQITVLQRSQADDSGILSGFLLGDRAVLHDTVIDCLADIAGAPDA